MPVGLKEIRILGFGNELAGDDSIAIKVIETLRELIENGELEIPEDIKLKLHILEDPSMIVDYLADFKTGEGDSLLFILDAVIGENLNPGEVKLIDKDFLERYPLQSTSSHILDLTSWLDLALTLGYLREYPPIIGIAINPSETTPLKELSGDLKVKDISFEVLKLILRHIEERVS